MKSNNWLKTALSETKSRWSFLFVTFSLVLFGFLYWYVFAFSSTMLPPCTFPDEVWLGELSLLSSPFWLFVIVFAGIGIWNICLYLSIKDVNFVQSLLFLANFLVVASLLFVLFKHYQFMYAYRDHFNSERYDLGTYFQIEYTFPLFYDDSPVNDCIQIAPFVGEWEVLEKSQSDYEWFGKSLSISKTMAISSDGVAWDNRFRSYLSELSHSGYETNYKERSLLRDMPNGRKVKGHVIFRENYYRHWISDWVFEMKGDYLAIYSIEYNRVEGAYVPKGDYAVLKRIPDKVFN